MRTPKLAKSSGLWRSGIFGPEGRNHIVSKRGTSYNAGNAVEDFLRREAHEGTQAHGRSRSAAKYNLCGTRLFSTGKDDEDSKEALLLAHAAMARQETDCFQSMAACARAIAEGADFKDPARMDIHDQPIGHDAQLVVFSDGEAEQPWGAYLRASCAHLDWLAAFFHRISDNKQAECHLVRAWGHLEGIVELWLTGTEEADLLNSTIDQLLDKLLIGSRPVVRWRSSVVAPVEFSGTIQCPDGWQAMPPPTAVSRAYFLPQLSAMLANDNSEQEPGLRSWEFVPIEKMSMDVTDPHYSAILSAPIKAVRMHDLSGDQQEDGGVRRGLIEWVMEFGDSHSDPKSGTSPNAWQRYLEQRPPEWCAASLVDFLASCRFIEIAYAKERIVNGAVKHIICELRSGDNVVARLADGVATDNPENPVPHMVDALAQKLGLSNIAKPILDEDDRAELFTSTVFEGGASAEGRFDRILSCLNAVDPYSLHGMYDSEFGHIEYERSQYRRFWSSGSHFLMTGHSFNFVGYRGPGDLALDRPRWGFSERTIHAIHMPQIYWYLFILIRFQRQSLDEFGKDMPTNKVLASDISKMRERWVQVRNNRWFNRVSTQIQGNEIYSLLRKQCKIEADIALLGEKLADLESVVALRESTFREEQKEEEARKKDQVERRIARRREMLQIFGVPAGVFIFLRAAMESGSGLKTTSVEPVFEYLLARLGISEPLLGLVAISYVIAFVGSLAFTAFVTYRSDKTEDYGGRRRKSYWKATAILSGLALFAVIFSLQVNFP